MGLDSLGAVELRNAVTAAFGIALRATLTFDYPTVAALATFVASRMRPADVADAGIERRAVVASMGDGQATDRALRTTDVMSVLLTFPGTDTGGASLRSVRRTTLR